MRLFDVPQAKYFCNPAASATAAVSRQSLRSFYGSIPKSVTRITEGQSHFNIHQVNLLSSVDLWLLFATTHYRRAIDMLIPASVPWAQVTLYYSSFFAANAILGMFGGWIGHTNDGMRVLDVEHGVPGSQELRIYRKLSSPSGANGSHRIFWDFFYDATASIAAWAPPSMVSALNPVNGDFGWQIAERNDVNYDMFNAWEASKRFQKTFKPSKLTSLSGPLKLQLDATEAMIRLALEFAKQLGLGTDALQGCGQIGSASLVRRRLGSQRPPQLVSQSAFHAFI
jgi:hypothetical protein